MSDQLKSAKEDGALAEIAPSALVPVVTHELADGLREIRARILQQRAKQKEKRANEQAETQEWQQNFLAKVPSIFPDVPAQALCSAAAAGSGGLHGYMRWFPPCAEFAKVHVSSPEVFAFLNKILCYLLFVLKPHNIYFRAGIP